MNKTVLTLKDEVPVPVEADVISPGVLAGKSNREIRELPLFRGNKTVRLGDLFEVEGEGADHLQIRGSLDKFKKIGRGMSRGKIHIAGNAGMHLGSMMSGGEIVVEGDAGDWAGAEMTGGVIRVRGNAGHLAGAAYRGSPAGMNGGAIIIEGNAGGMVGELMRRGLIAVMGSAGDFAGAMMKGGTIFIFGSAGERPGGGMNRGTLVVFQKPLLLPTFRYDCRVNSVCLRVALNLLQRMGVGAAGQYMDSAFLHYSGDFAESGKGEILIHDQC